MSTPWPTGTSSSSWSASNASRRTDTILQALRAENIGATFHYPLVYRHAFYRERFGYAAGLCPSAEAAEARLMTLPLFPAMTEADQDDVLRALDKIFAHYAR